jgi:plastocyanin
LKNNYFCVDIQRCSWSQKTKFNQTELIMKTKLLFALLCASFSAMAQQTHHITWMMGISLEEASLTIEVGDTVIWTWGQNGMPHNVTSIDPNAPEGFGSETMSDIGSTYEFTFTEATTFDYRCSIHNTMTGVIEVQATAAVDSPNQKSLVVYPNPVQHTLFVSEPANLTLTNLTGQIVAKEQNVSSLDISTQQAGIYFLTISDTSDTMLQQTKIVKQ